MRLYVDDDGVDVVEPSPWLLTKEEVQIQIADSFHEDDLL